MKPATLLAILSVVLSTVGLEVSYTTPFGLLCGGISWFLGERSLGETGILLAVLEMFLRVAVRRVQIVG